MKPRASKLDPYSEQLAEMEAQHKTLAEMQAWLSTQGVSASLGLLSSFLEAQRTAALQDRLFGLVATGARMNSELDAAFAKNPEPQIERLIQVTKTLVLSLQTQGVANPELLNLANAMQRTVLDYASGKTRAELEDRKLDLQERRVALLEQKAAAFDKVKEAVNTGGLTPETLTRIERELKLL